MKKKLLFFQTYFGENYDRADDAKHTIEAFKKFFYVETLTTKNFKSSVYYQKLQFLEKKIDEINPDIVFFIGPEAYPYFTNNFLIRLKQKYFLINWSADQELYRTTNLFFNQYMDFVLSHAPWELHKALDKSQYDYLFSGNYKINKKKIKKKIDVITIGSMFKSNRKEYTDFLKDNGIKILDYGPGSTNGILSSKNYFKKINQSKIVIRFSGRDIKKNINPLRIDPLSKNIKSQSVGINDYFSCGAFLLCERMSLESKVKRNKHLVFFNSKKDLLEKIEFYLKNKKERKIIEKNCFKLFCKYYEETKLIKAISKKIYLRFKKKTYGKNYNIGFFVKMHYIKLFNNFQILTLKIQDLSSLVKFFLRILKFPYFSYFSIIKIIVVKIKKKFL